MNKEIGRRIKEARDEKDLTLKELGDLIGVASSTILRYENGEIEKIKLPIIESIANALKVDPAWLVLKSDSPNIIKHDENNASEIPFVGNIAAGTPILAEENIDGYFYLDKRIKADFCLKIKGDSMIGAGIFPDDIVFIRKQEYLENGEIGAILLDDEATLKKFYKNNKSIVLQPENTSYEPMVFRNGNIRILGKLVAVLNIRE